MDIFDSLKQRDLPAKSSSEETLPIFLVELATFSPSLVIFMPKIIDRFNSVAEHTNNNEINIPWWITFLVSCGIPLVIILSAIVGLVANHVRNKRLRHG